MSVFITINDNVPSLHIFHYRGEKIIDDYHSQSATAFSLSLKCEPKQKQHQTVFDSLSFCDAGSGFLGAGERDVCHPGRTNPWAKTLWRFS